MERPDILTHIVKNQPLGANCHNGLTDTLNWVIDFCDHLDGDNVTVQVDKSITDWPTISAKGLYKAGEGGGTVETDNISINHTLDENDNPTNTIQVFDFENPSFGDLTTKELPEIPNDPNNNLRFIARDNTGSTPCLKYVDLYQGDTYGTFRFTPNTGTTNSTAAVYNPETGQYELQQEPCGTITHPHLMVGRKVVTVLQSLNNITDGFWYIRYSHVNRGVSVLKLDTTDTQGGNWQTNGNDVIIPQGTPASACLPKNTLTDTYVPLFNIHNQRVVDDYRGMICIPVWEDTQTISNT